MEITYRDFVVGGYTAKVHKRWVQPRYAKVAAQSIMRDGLIIENPKRLEFIPPHNIERVVVWEDPGSEELP